jgi:hypothetical protein
LIPELPDQWISHSASHDVGQVGYTAHEDHPGPGRTKNEELMAFLVKSESTYHRSIASDIEILKKSLGLMDRFYGNTSH